VHGYKEAAFCGHACMKIKVEKLLKSEDYLLIGERPVLTEQTIQAA
jgi:hypothetical protein